MFRSDNYHAGNGRDMRHEMSLLEESRLRRGILYTGTYCYLLCLS